MADVLIWDGPVGIVELACGEKVLVQPGDELLAEELEDGSLSLLSHERPKHN